MIEKYTKKDGTVAYQFQIYLGIDPVSGKPIRTRRRGFKTKREATIAESQLRAEVENRGFKPNNDVRFHEVCDMWMFQYKNTVRESTFNSVSALVRSGILPVFGQMKIKDITVMYCQKVINEWSEKHVTYRKYKSYASAVFDTAVQMDIIQSNPFKSVKTPRTKETFDNDKMLYYTTDELKQFLSFLENDIMNLAIFRTLAFTGLRRGEIMALRWNDIDFSKKTLSVTKTVANGTNGQVIHPPKTKKSKRTISLDDKTLSILKQYKLFQATELLKSGFNANKPEQLVFANLYTNKLLSNIGINRRLQIICDRHNFKRIKLHGFRHTHCSLLFESGATIQEVQDRLGHGSIDTTMEVYAHVTDKQRDNMAERFAKYVNF